RRLQDAGIESGGALDPGSVKEALRKLMTDYGFNFLVLNSGSPAYASTQEMPQLRLLGSYGVYSLFRLDGPGP
ncbi:MAG: hypothetical protein V2B18_16485, partial [Pseudomonadota bacterium]